ncbi:HAMP domain-containing sensor histidine kinase [Niallia taxi]|uniref:histidine kinase n=1 Tax=Niallia taxi TaxID=2499688 RepID=A0A3S2X3C8_9BACI|nr:HAMP domain-containing sensor histidine kinase [Niallia taxi]MCM3217197.1 HAMP domain-containing histidine kinase [Niallia taxi]MCT2347260.1 HAMP domain-containing histidine kinase [Niallia taxi]MDK8642667.1 HAMP domain-containing sensor histidine kinase [Niallia taxi]MED3961705.1 HAMP domain-containing sensor histidine kinase [Niallia taxi]MED4037408.1 HAMP domain-containing sensor histidine kinase [Niallia taxi]
MFQKTRIKLTFLNSLVFILLMVVLGVMIYHYTEKQIYKDINKSLEEAVESVSHPDQREVGRGPVGDPQISLIKWTEDKEIDSISQNIINYASEFENFYPKDYDRIVEKQTVSGYSYNTIAVKVKMEDGTKETFQFIRSTNPEKSMLNRLIIIMTLGVLAGSIFAILAGYFLAGRALVPIQKSWESQQQFVSDASHELRTPLAVIQSRTDLLFQEPDATIQEKAIDISVISKETRRLNKLVTSLLTLARSDSNQMEISKQEFALDVLIQEVIDQYADIAEFQGKRIYTDTITPIKLIGDKERIHQLLVILVDNSMKFTDEGGTIAINAAAKAHTIELEVKDNGIGIPKQDISKIFNRFYQVEQSRTDIEGTGLGLSIAKWIIDKHSGTIRVDSELEKGTRFEITFPKLGQ